MTIAALAALAAAAAVAVFAAAFALYAWTASLWGPAIGGAAVSAVFALIVALAGLLAARKAHPSKPAAEEATLASKLFELARERPLLAAGAAVAAGLVALKNPKILTTVLTALLAGKAASSGRD